MDDSESAPQAPEDIGTGQQPPENTPTEQMPGPSQPEGQEPQPQEETVSPQEQTTPQPTYAEPTPKPRLNLSLPRVNPRIIGAVIAVLVIGILIFKFAPAIITPTTTTTTTVKPIGLNKINSCVTISQPGTYYIISDINTSLLKGPCIKINASSVWLVGNQHTITGNGPYTGVPPFSYGIEIQGGKNDTITNVKVLRFSYDLFLNGSSSSVIGLNNFTQATLSGIYFLNSYNNTIEQNYIAGSVSRQGGIYLSSGGKNRFLNNSVVNNYYYGIVINSSNNNFTHNNFGSNGADLVCNQNTAPKNTNIFAGSTCRVNDYCAFASCSTNIPLNLSLVRLSEGSVNNCGTIYSPGNYTLAKSLSTSAYVSSSNPLANKMPCIQILAPNVNFNCKNKQISNSGYAIYMRGTANANVTDCVFYNDTYGIDAVTSYNPLITNALAINDTYGIYLNNATSGKVSSSNFTKNTYGVYINLSAGITFDKIVSRGNIYGIYYGSGENNYFNGGNVTGNRNADLFCSAANYNSSISNIASFSDCGVTDCAWATSSCKQFVQPSLPVHPVSDCRSIDLPGNYSLQQNVIANKNCFSIHSNNVTFNCNYNIVSGSNTGSAFLIDNSLNVSVLNCNIESFATGVNVTNSNQIGIKLLNINTTLQGITAFNVLNSTVTNVKVYGAATNAFSFNTIRDSLIANDTALAGNNSASGFSFTRAFRNQILFNNATSNPLYGFRFINSLNNTIMNNSAFSNAASDYACFGSSTGLYAEPIGIDNGITKSGCSWLVEINPIVTGNTCSAFFSPTQITLNTDLLFTSGSTCFGIYTANASASADDSSINCNGHTIYSVSGGAFLIVSNTSNVKLSNCVILNFTTGVEGTVASGAGIFNNTFVHEGIALVLNGSRFQSVYRNTIDNNTNGMIIDNLTLANIYNNNFYNNTVSISLFNDSGSAITNNTDLKSEVGIYFKNVTSTSMMNNMFAHSSISGISCAGSAITTKSGNIDGGGNMCSSNNNCNWVTSSAECSSS